jgi:hypothetical protein
MSATMFSATLSWRLSFLRRAARYRRRDARSAPQMLKSSCEASRASCALLRTPNFSRMAD